MLMLLREIISEGRTDLQDMLDQIKELEEELAQAKENRENEAHLADIEADIQQMQDILKRHKEALKR
jgi:ribosome-interacting GTPase 1